MGAAPATDDLAESRYRTLVLRLTTAADGAVRRGTLVDMDGHTIAHVRSLAALPDAIAQWLNDDEIDGT